MALPQGINFRATSGYVSDPTGTTNEVSKVVNYPRTTPQGNNVGWETLTGTLDTRNRNSGVDARLAGVEFLGAGAGNSAIYRIDLPSSGSYNVRAALGDIGFSVRVGAILQDGSTDVATLIADDTVTGAGGNFYDATGTLRNGESDWVANNAALTQSFSTSILRVRIPGSSAVTKSIAHFYVEAAGGGSIELTASNSSQTDTSANGAINQSHVLTASASAQTDNSSDAVITQIHVISANNGTQTDTSATGQISQTHELTSANSEQTDASSAGFLGQTHALSGAASSETDTSSSGVLTQTHVLSIANSTQTDASSTGAIASMGDLVASNCTQTDTSASGAITQTHQLAVDGCDQTDASSTGIISVGSVINLAAANSAQTDISQTAIITQTHILIAAPSVQDDVASSSAIVQLHLLLAANSIQTDASSSATIINPLDVLEIPNERIIAATRDNRIIYINQWGRYGN